jgi:putative transposase
LDNSREHQSEKTITKARKLKITLVFLPPYSPDLNPVEFIWKSIKRGVSARFIKSKQHLRNRIKAESTRIEKSLSFAKKRIETFHTQIKSIIS